MLGVLQQCHCLAAGSWAGAAAAAVAGAANVQQLPSLWAAFHTSGSCQQISGSKRLQSIMDANAANVPSRAWAGHDKATLTDAQQESLAIFKRFNISQPYLRGQVILAKVLRATPKHLLVDPGYYSLNSVARQDLASAAAYNEHGEPIPRKSAVINPGEYVKVRLSAFNTPYGDAQLDPVGVPRDVRQKLVWEELEYRMQKGLSVQGRILNATAGGYAVGVAGYVALLQRQQASVQQTRKIGVLQDFYIHRMDRKRRRIELSNMQRHRESKEDLYKDTM